MKRDAHHVQQLVVKVAVPIVAAGMPYLPSLPNQSMEPTATAVTHPADAGCAPAVAVAHH